MERQTYGATPVMVITRWTCGFCDKVERVVEDTSHHVLKYASKMPDGWRAENDFESSTIVCSFECDRLRRIDDLCTPEQAASIASRIGEVKGQKVAP